jgi:thioredoxin 1
MSQVHHIASAAEFQNLLSSTTYVIADFYADWCGPCKVIAPVFSELASSHSATGQLAFAKVNVDALQDVAATYGVSAMPTFIVFRDGQVANSVRGANPAALRAAVQDVERELAKRGEAENVDGGAKGRKEAGQGRSDTGTVSGSYSMSSSARSDWKMSLRG